MKPATAVFQVSSDISRRCPECRFSFSADELDTAINHLIQEHAYTLEHVGPETKVDNNEKPYHRTVAFLAKRS